jgi:hypothetical protein
VVQAAVLGLLDARFNTTTDLQFIPNMDGFPNGRRLEDDVTRIELQAVSGVVLAAIGFWYDDFVSGGSPVTQKLLNVVGYKTGVEANDAPFKTSFPFVQTPWAGTHNCDCTTQSSVNTRQPGKPVVNYNTAPLEMKKSTGTLLNAPDVIMKTYPNPFTDNTTIQYQLRSAAQIKLAVYDVKGNQVEVLVNKVHDAGSYSEQFDGKDLPAGVYFVNTMKDGAVKQTVKILKD